jgi:hypothetical protein
MSAFPFTYTLKRRRRVVHIGRGAVAERTDTAVQRWLRATVAAVEWDQAVHAWHDSEALAIRAERLALHLYAWASGRLPFGNARGEPPGLSPLVPCVAQTEQGHRCSNQALRVLGGRCGSHAGLAPTARQSAARRRRATQARRAAATPASALAQAVSPA